MAALFKTPKMPAIEKPAPMPNESDTNKARRRMLAKQKSGSGVESTILSQAGSRESLGA